MQRALAMRFFSQQRMKTKRVMEPSCDVFLNHRCMDTKKTVATLLYDHLRRKGLKPFLDEKNMKPGDKLFDKINTALFDCKIGVAVFSPRYCESYFCLHELALLMGCNKKVIPIFCDVKPSQLHVVNNPKWSHEDRRRFTWALQEAKHILGLTFNSSKGNLSDIVTSASDIIIANMLELQNGKHHIHHQTLPIPL